MSTGLPTPYYDHDGITIYNADCRDILPLLPRVDLVLTDPPYGIGNWSANSSGGFMDSAEAAKINQWDVAPSREELMDLVSLAPAILWGGNYLELPPSPKMLVWDKCQDGMHFAEHEVDWTSFTAGTSRVLRCPLKSQEIFGPHSERRHPTQKPVKLMLLCIEWSKTTGTILDPFMGSGTTLVAAKNLGRRAIGIEIEERYCEIAAKRLSQEVLMLEGM